MYFMYVYTYIHMHIYRYICIYVYIMKHSRNRSFKGAKRTRKNTKRYGRNGTDSIELT